MDDESYESWRSVHTSITQISILKTQDMLNPEFLMSE